MASPLCVMSSGFLRTMKHVISKEQPVPLFYKTTRFSTLSPLIKVKAKHMFLSPVFFATKKFLGLMV